MPLYEYRCEDCGTTFEKFVRSFSGKEEIKCPECASEEVSKTFSTFATRGTRSAGTQATDCAPGGG